MTTAKMIKGMLWVCALMCTTVMAVEPVEKPTKAGPPISSVISLADLDLTLYREITEGAELYTGRRISEAYGYIVESGAYRQGDGDLGSIIIVRTLEGQVTALVDMPKRHGIFLGSKGKTARFVDMKNYNTYNEEDTVADQDEVAQETYEKAHAGAQNTIDVAVAYSTYALSSLGVDPVAYALAQLETVNLGLRNSKVEGTSLRLGAVNVFNTDSTYSTSSTGLGKWQTLMNRYRSAYKTDINMAITGTNGDASGRAYKPGYTSVNGWFSPTVFRHELGHNVGGGHCNSGESSYKFGYNNGRSRTFLCGNSAPYYSTPDVVDEYGLALGDKTKADMARLWREQSARMAGYNPELPGKRLLFISANQPHSVSLRLTGDPRPFIGVVALSADVGPTQLKGISSGGHTELHVELSNLEGQKHTVKFRGTRTIDGCGSHPMNATVGCVNSDPLHFKLTYDPADNPNLPSGTYNGMVSFEAKVTNASPQVEPIHAIISLYRL